MIKQHKRHWVKAVSYRVFGTLVSTAVAYVVSHDIRVSASVFAIDGIGKIFLYYLHECVWDRIRWGTHQPQTEIGEIA
jgi:uncharacterized membrane protein